MSFIKLFVKFFVQTVEKSYILFRESTGNGGYRRVAGESESERSGGEEAESDREGEAGSTSLSQIILGRLTFNTVKFWFKY